MVKMKQMLKIAKNAIHPACESGLAGNENLNIWTTAEPQPTSRVRMVQESQIFRSFSQLAVCGTEKGK
jgi:hypothetical protein